MIDITHKSNTLRIAKAQAIVKVGSKETIERIKNKTVPKGDILEMAKTAGLFAVKKTAEMIPDCHPMPVESTTISYEIEEDQVVVFIEVKTIYKTGVEVEAMHGASVVALTMYDMLKPIDKNVEIHSIKLNQKSGGKSDYKKKLRDQILARVIVCSDTISAGQKEDKAGLKIIEKLESNHVEIENYSIVPDEKDQIQNLIHQGMENKARLIICTGGTGLSIRDVSTEAVSEIIEREIPGAAETMRSYGQNRTPYSMLSRSVVGEKNGVIIMALPGSTKGAEESMDAIFPAILHVFGILKGERH